ncbi:MAG TPA: hypothetical protein VHR45_25545 [Thermoanaerobaculia bacterium]|nr:hypothetical protein [Thermoanaerobaculia bacterium]
MDALENIRGATVFAQAALDEPDDATAQKLMLYASFNTRDSIKVLDERSLHLASLPRLKRALLQETNAAATSDKATRKGDQPDGRGEGWNPHPLARRDCSRHRVPGRRVETRSRPAVLCVRDGF